MPTLPTTLMNTMGESIESFIRTLEGRNVNLFLDGETVNAKGPKAVIQEFASTIRERKPEIITYLQAQASDRSIFGDTVEVYAMGEVERILQEFCKRYDRRFVSRITDEAGNILGANPNLDLDGALIQAIVKLAPPGDVQELEATLNGKTNDRAFFCVRQRNRRRYRKARREVLRIIGAGWKTTIHGSKSHRGRSPRRRRNRQRRASISRRQGRIQPSRLRCANGSWASWRRCWAYRRRRCFDHRRRQ